MASGGPNIHSLLRLNPETASSVQDLGDDWVFLDYHPSYTRKLGEFRWASRKSTQIEKIGGNPILVLRDSADPAVIMDPAPIAPMADSTIPNEECLKKIQTNNSEVQ